MPRARAAQLPRNCCGRRRRSGGCVRRRRKGGPTRSTNNGCLRFLPLQVWPGSCVKHMKILVISMWYPCLLAYRCKYTNIYIYIYLYSYLSIYLSIYIYIYVNTCSNANVYMQKRAGLSFWKSRRRPVIKIFKLQAKVRSGRATEYRELAVYTYYYNCFYM